ncbi:MAG: hypothetical protein E7346_00250 [Clostridiales bacterium]|nr:hypothetical protein [Clostridiales bacterium]
MQIDFLSVLMAVVSLILLAVPAFILSKAKLLPEKADNVLSTLVLYGCQPVLVFMSFQGQAYKPEIAKNMLITLGLGILVHLIMIAIAMFCIRGDESNEKRLRCVRAGSVFGNCAYMGLPFLNALFGGTEIIGEVMIYTACVLAAFNILNWTFGVYMLTGDIKQVSLKKIALNPTILGTLLGFIVFITVKTPFIDLAAPGTTGYLVISNIVKSLNVIGDTVTPLAMFVIGIRLSKIELKKLFIDKYAYLTSFLKLIVSSLVVILLVAFLPISTIVKYTLFFLLSMPCATSTALFAVQFGADGDSASVYVLLSTVLSLATIPLMFLLFSSGFRIVV